MRDRREPRVGGRGRQTNNRIRRRELLQRCVALALCLRRSSQPPAGRQVESRAGESGPFSRGRAFQLDMLPELVGRSFINNGHNSRKC